MINSMVIYFYISLKNLISLDEIIIDSKDIDNYDNWVGVGIGRALLAIPGHFFFAIIMGYFYSLSHFTSSLVKRPMYLSFAILMPILAHGLYDGFLMVQSVLPDIACMLSLAVIFLLIRLRKISKKHIANLLRKDGVV